MKIVQNGYKHKIFNDGMIVHNQLTPQVYTIKFNREEGFYLETHADIEVKEIMYGEHESKVNKVMQGFDMFERNLGVILSGDKGIGKSLFSKALSQRMIAAGYPVIIVNSYYDGIADFINELEQEVMVLFDEFDKTFPSSKDRFSDDSPTQNEMLTVFDGVSQGKKMFVVTCNDVYSLSSFLVNRPGRFHYHFRFQYPTAKEIETYMQDKVAKEYYGEIQKVIDFSAKMDLNYDCLRAIAFELNMGVTFAEAMTYLNIINVKLKEMTITINGTFSDGSTFSACERMPISFKEDIQLVYPTLSVAGSKPVKDAICIDIDASLISLDKKTNKIFYNQKLEDIEWEECRYIFDKKVEIVKLDIVKEVEPGLHFVL